MFLFVVALTPVLAPSQLADNSDQAAVRKSMVAAIDFFDQRVSVEGGYLWRYSSDLTLREGEGRADAATAWVQPPGTPSVGLALLECYQRTGEPTALAAAKRAARALVRGQLESGGWDYRIHFNEQARLRYRYRQPRPTAHKPSDKPSGSRNVTTLDDNTTQAALQFLMLIDRELEMGDAEIHEAVQYGLQQLLKAQYPNGAWPQRFDAPPDNSKHPVAAANYPASWSRKYSGEDYRGYYTFNDNSIADVVRTMFMAHEVYKEGVYREAAIRAGDFMVLAQMPAPQPGWAQQYNAQMQPAWARKFEPPAVTGGEAQGVMRTLLEIYDQTGEERFLAPLAKAIPYYRSSLRSDGRLARFYELKTNKPLYFTKDYRLTYSDADMPTHYGFIVGSSLDAIEKQYERLKTLGATHRSFLPEMSLRAPSTRAIRDGLAVAKELDTRGAWVTRGKLSTHSLEDGAIIETRVFIQNLRRLSHSLSRRTSQ